MAHGAALPVALLVLGSASYWLALRAETGTEPLTPQAESTPPVAAPVLAPAAAASAAVPPAASRVKPVPADPDQSRQLALPDGTFVPALNNAVEAAPLADYWGNWPWSPIVGVEANSAGIDWYRHEDGSYSTTQMVWRSDKQRYLPMTRVAHPSPQTAATSPDAGH